MNLKKINTYRDVADVARTTVGMKAGTKEPAEWWKKRMLLSEHSPIRKMKYSWIWEGIKSWVSVHFVRHKFGIEHFVRTQRTDRTGTDRNKLPQDSPVNHECEANAQALINISRKRLCMDASKETRIEWNKVKREVNKVDPILASVMVPECYYRGFCPMFKPCGLSDSPVFDKKLKEYREVKK